MTAVGRCLCGAVTVEANGLAAEISACHCNNCRRWSGSMQMGIHTPADGVSVRGPVKVHQSSAIAERAWCDTCGSALWLRDTVGSNAGIFELAPGLFDNAAGATLVREVYADKCPTGYAFAGAHRRVGKAEYEKMYPFVDEGDSQ